MKTALITFLSVISALILAQIPAIPSGFVVNPYVFSAAGGGGGPIAKDSNTVTAHASSSASDPETWTQTISSTTDGYVTVQISTYGQTVNGVTFDGSSMTQLVTATTATDDHSYIYGLAIGSKSGGTYTISVDYSGSGAEIAAGAVTWNNVHQTTSTGTTTTTTTASTTPSMTLTMSSGDVMTGQIEFWSVATVTEGDTFLWEVQNSGTTDGAGSYISGVTGSQVLNWTLSASPTHLTGCSVLLKPANP